MSSKEIIFLVEEDPEGGYNARALGNSIFTEGDDIDELKQNIKEALHCHFDKPENIPPIIRLHIVKEEVVTL
ncbi:MAG: 2-oxoisovalerate dehydrogenase [Clostridiales bacterium]|nr:2-oxoisovalerate dehydrogenase [Clostridiales bacterium]MCF8023189.1 2-oxoisovalerate dehydrogenase [Clostridiales bacterium]